jgi:DNA-binding MarR family transcriptional regulator
VVAAAASEVSIDRMRKGVVPLVMRVFFYTRRNFDEAMRPHGVTASQLGALAQIFEHPGISGAEISRQMGTTPQAVHLMLSTLEHKGLIEREPHSAQGRVVSSHLTEEGEQAFVNCLLDALAVEKRLSQYLTTDERRTLIRLLGRCLEGLQSERHDDPGTTRGGGRLADGP